MFELLRALRLGIVNIFGIAIPGFIIIFFIFFGLLVPIISTTFFLIGIDWSGSTKFYENTKFEIFGLVVIFSYVAGYILRLSTPDDLDKVSAGQVLETLEKEDEKYQREEDKKEQNMWAFSSKKNSSGEYIDKYPYSNFKNYLKARNHIHLLKYVTWGEGIEVDEKTAKRSKTAVNIMKLDIIQECPELSEIVESNEAHIRLMSGTWIAIKYTMRLIWIGMYVSSAGIVSLLFLPHSHETSLIITAIISVFLLISIYWAKYRIENLFHYRRVNELVLIVEAVHRARQKKENANLYSC